MSTPGPGATNFVTLAAYTQRGMMPMLMITGQKPIQSSKQGHFQIVDIPMDYSENDRVLNQELRNRTCIL